ncbi:MAG: HmuY family protein [candidate division Zixibacteria bacterium]|jgi:hypothetical protein|nr:HmuY family protein [candidate division Zixibacteria bacterium]
MKRILLFFGFSLAALGLAAGCSDDDHSASGPTGPSGSAGFQDTSVFDAATGTWTTTLNASSHTTPKTFSFSETKAAGWDIMFRRSNINLNGGDAGAESVAGYDMGTAKAFADVVLSDTTGVSWEEDAQRYIIDSFYTYNFVTHQLDMTRYVYAMVDAEGDNFVKFQIDSLVGAGAPPNMGTVWISYYYQPTANSRTLSGAVQTASITVGSGIAYFDFSSGTQVTPSNPTASTEWDLRFASYEIAQNSGPNGAGSCAVFPAFTELTDKTDIASFASVPATAALFPDFIGSVFNGSLTDDSELWYDYDGTTHTLTSKSHVYLIKSADAVYKMEIIGWYADINGSLTSGYYTFKWAELQ